LANANSYASAVDGEAYHSGHCYASAWTVATTANKEKALGMATRLIGANYHFHDWKRGRAWLKDPLRFALIRVHSRSKQWVTAADAD
jgi:hypothetical protein